MSLKIINRFFLLLLLLKGIPVHSQVIDIEWEMTFGGNGDDRGTAIIQSADSGFVVVGYSNSFDGDITSPHGGQDYWVTKLDSLGNLEWQKSYGGSGYDLCFDVCKGINGGCLLVGQTQSVDGDVTENLGGNDIWVVKLNDEGEIEWQKSYGGTAGESAQAVLQSSDGNYIITGYTLSIDGDIVSNHGGIDIWIIKISDTGVIIWQKTFGSSNNDSPQDIVETSSGNFYIVGYSEGWDGDVTGNHGSADYWILKINAVGDIIWERTYGGSLGDIAKSVALTNNGIICVGQTYSNNYDVAGFHGLLDAWAVAIDSMGNFQWQRPYGGTGGDEAYAIAKISNNAFVYSGRSSAANGDVTENMGGVDYWVVSIDSLGNIIWQKSIGGSNNEESFDITVTVDSQIIVTGYSASSDLDVTAAYTFNNFWVAKLAKCENVYYLDNDNDGFGNILLDTIACALPIGYATNGLDCDDSNYSVNPDASEICNTLDDNCNFVIDEDLLFTTYFADADGDNFGDAEMDSVWCTTISGYVLNNTDCDDTNPNIYPGAEEVLNGLDDDCNNLIDEGLAIENTVLNTIKIYPNPTTGILFIEWTNTNPAQIKLINSNGEIIATITKEFPINKIDLINYPAGIYLLQTDIDLIGVKIIKE